MMFYCFIELCCILFSGCVFCVQLEWLLREYVSKALTLRTFNHAIRLR